MKSRCILVLAFLIAVGFSAWADVPGDDPESLLGIQVGPYLIYPDNNTQMILKWGKFRASLLIVLDGGFDLYWGPEGSCSAHAVNISPAQASDGLFSYTFSNLSPGDKYCYELVALDESDAPVQSYHGDFYAAPGPSDPRHSTFSFFGVGDTQDNISEAWFPIADSMREIMSHNATTQTFLLHFGDIEFENRAPVLFIPVPGIPITETFFRKDSDCRGKDELLKRVPTMVTRGNHDKMSTIAKYFPYPQMNHGANGLYSFDYGDAHFISIDTKLVLPYTIRQFIESDLGSTSKRWRIAYFHKPGFRWDGGDVNPYAEIEEHIIPLLHSYGVQLILNGHVHNHTRARPFDDTVYHVISGGGGGGLDGDCGPVSELLCKRYHFLRVDVSGGTLEVHAKLKDDASTGSGFDSFEVRAGVRADFDVAFEPDRIRFTDRSANLMDGSDITTWSWDFDGDGLEDAHSPSPAVLYSDYPNPPAEQPVEVALTVWNGTGDSHTHRRLVPKDNDLLLLSFDDGSSVEVGTWKKIRWFFNPAILLESGCENFKAQIVLAQNDTSVGTIREQAPVGSGYGEYEWKVGDVVGGGVDPGDHYTVWIDVDGETSGEPGDPGGSCFASVESPYEFSIRPHPTTDVEADFGYQIDGLRVRFTDGSTCSGGSIDTWSWSFGDDSGSTQQGPHEHVYAQCGEREVRLGVGCGAAHDTMTKSLTLCPGGKYGDIDITAPSSASAWRAGETHTVRWDGRIGGAPIAHSLELSLWQGQEPDQHLVETIETIPAALAGGGSWSLYLPPAFPAGSWYRVKLHMTTDQSVYGYSEYFRVVPVSGLPFGSFDSPVDGATGLSGSVAVTGWALDDTEVVSVRIYRNPIAGEGGSLVYIGQAGFSEGTRPDVTQAYPGYPYNTRAGWGYLMLTNGLPNGGNGTFTLRAIATDNLGNTSTLGSKSITVDNANATKPFGAIDTPAPFETVSGTYVVWGWALTPLPNTIPVDGSTITVYVDDQPIGKLNRGEGQSKYGIYRADVAAAFPGYNNTGSAVGYYYLDTTAFDNGRHTIAWLVIDDAGNSDGIGSRYFFIDNGTPPAASMSVTSPNGAESWGLGTSHSITWHSVDVGNDLKISLLRNASLVGVIANHVGDTGTYPWSVGTYSGGTAPAASGYSVRIEENGGTVADESDGTFSITASTVCGDGSCNGSETCATCQQDCCPSAVCTPGQTQQGSCGSCGEGTRQRTCDSTGQWGYWGTCVGHGCTPGNEQEQACGGCGTRTRTCSSTCAWNAWSPCQGDFCNFEEDKSFETGTGWDFGSYNQSWPGSSIWRYSTGTAEPRTGAYALSLSNQAYAYPRTDFIAAGPGSHNVAAWVRGEMSESSKGGWALRVLFFDSSKQALPPASASAASCSGSATCLTDSWIRKSGTVTAPAGTAYVKVALYFNLAGGWVAYDDVELDGEALSVATHGVDGGFETATGWSWNTYSFFPASSVWRGTWGTAEPRTGDRALALSNQAYALPQTDLFAASPGTHTLSVWAKGELEASTAGGWQLRAYFYDSSQTEISYAAATGCYQGGSSCTYPSWTQKSGTVTAPSGTAYMAIRILYYMADGWFAFDDVALDGQVLDAATHGADGGFETATGWNLSTNASWPATALRRWNTSPVVHSGSYGLYVGNHAYAQPDSDYEPMTPGGSGVYRVSAWVRGEMNESSRGGWIIRTYFYDSDMDELSWQNVGSCSGAASCLSTTWAQKSGDVTAPSGTAYMKVRLYFQDTGGWAAFDDVDILPLYCSGTDCY